MRANATDGDCNNEGRDLVANACTAVGIEDVAEPSGFPTVFALHRPYPNPFNPATTITYDVPQTAEVRLEVFDPLGRRVEVLGTWRVAPGTHAVTWEPGIVPSGVYLVRMHVGDFNATRRVLLLR